MYFFLFFSLKGKSDVNPIAMILFERIGQPNPPENIYNYFQRKKVVPKEKEEKTVQQIPDKTPVINVLKPIKVDINKLDPNLKNLKNITVLTLFNFSQHPRVDAILQFISISTNDYLTPNNINIATHIVRKNLFLFIYF